MDSLVLWERRAKYFLLFALVFYIFAVPAGIMAIVLPESAALAIIWAHFIVQVLGIGLSVRLQKLMGSSYPVWALILIQVAVQCFTLFIGTFIYASFLRAEISSKLKEGRPNGI